MNREIKFRGKRIDNGEWVIGSYHYCTQNGIISSRKWGTICDLIDEEVQFNQHWILEHRTPNTTGWGVRDTFRHHAVTSESVGQFTGLKDKNGKEIYEGDILKSFSSSVPSYEVFYCKSSYRLRYKLKNGEYYDWGPLYRMEEIQWEGRLPLCPDVIGNIHDNPELLNAASAITGNSNMNIDPGAKSQEAATEEQAALNAAEDQANEALGEPTESAEEGGTEG